jgi:hypothetical protein
MRFRAAWSRYHRPDDANHLLRIFRKVQLRGGYVLDYVPLGRAGAGWIWPYARKEGQGITPELPSSLKRIPPDRLVGQRRGDSLRHIEIETLYDLLEYERSPEGLVEYGFFLNELWATKSVEHEGAWLDLRPLLTRHKFDTVLRRQANQLVTVSKPDHYDPIVTLGERDGSFSFLAFQPGPWRRILRVVIEVSAEGDATWRPDKVVANLAGKA